MPGLESLIERLAAHKVEFVVIGGLAAAAHGAQLFTLDIDICCRFTPQNLMRLQEAVKDLRPVHRMTPSKLPLRLTEEGCRTLKNLYLDTEYGQLDCLSCVDGLGDYLAVKKQSVEIRFGKTTCRVLSIDALITAKEAIGRPKDRQAIQELKTIKERLGR